MLSLSTSGSHSDDIELQDMEDSKKRTSDPIASQTISNQSHETTLSSQFPTTETTTSTPMMTDDSENRRVVVELNNVHKTYLLGIEGVPALRGVTLQIERGEFVCVYGTSGGGKTSLLNIIGTIDRPTKGHLSICGLRITGNTPDKELAHIRLNNLGFVFQTFNLLSSLTALENVEMPMILAGVLSPSERRARAKQLLAKVGMSKRIDHLPSQLSGGEQQRVTIARAIANQPEILLLDEPTGDLDTVNTTIVMKLLTDLNKNENITLIMVTHDVSLKYFADRIIWLRDGKIQRIEQVDRSKREQTYQKMYQDLRTIEGTRGGGLISGVGTERADGQMGGDQVGSTRPNVSFENTLIRKTNRLHVSTSFHIISFNFFDLKTEKVLENVLLFFVS